MPERLPRVLRLRIGTRQPERRRHHTRATVHQITVGSWREPRRSQLHLQRGVQDWSPRYDPPGREAPVNESLFPDCRKAAPTRGLFVYHLSTACPEVVGSNGFTWRCRSTRALAARRSCSSTSASSERASNIMYRSARQPAGTRTSHSGGKMRTSASIAASSARDWSDFPSVPT